MVRGRDAERLLAERARRVARPSEVTRAAPTVEVLTVTVAKRRFAVEARFVTRVLRCGRVSRLPAGSHALSGVVMVGDAAVPVVDLASLTGATDPQSTRPFVVLVDTTGQPLGLLVDEVGSFDHEDEASFRRADVAAGEAAPERGLTSDGAVLLDAEVLLADPRTHARRQTSDSDIAPTHQERHEKTDNR